MMAEAPKNVVAVTVPGGVKLTWTHPGGTYRGFRIDLNKKSTKVFAGKTAREAIVPLSVLPSGMWSVLALYVIPGTPQPGVINYRSKEVAITGEQIPPVPEPSPSPTDGLVFSVDYRTNDVSQWPNHNLGCHRTWCQNVLTKVGRKSCRFETRAELKPGVKVRSEVMESTVMFGSEWWYTWSSLIPPEWRDSSRDFIVTTQFHQNFSTNDGIKSHPPPLRFSYSGGRWKIGLSFWGGAGPGELYSSVGPRDIWVNWMVHAKWRTDSQGLLQIWKDNALIVDYKGKTCNSQSNRGPYFKCGVYVGPKEAYDKIIFHGPYKRGGTKASVG
jgi:hypothetical protein